MHCNRLVHTQLSVALFAALGLSTGVGYAQTTDAQSTSDTGTHAQSAQQATVQEAGAASSQSKSKIRTLQTVAVTGTLISGVAPVGAHSVQIDRQQIVSTGAVRTQDIFNSVPAVTNLFNAHLSPGAGASGGTTVLPTIHDISGSGANTTLLLVNGHNVVGNGILQTAPDIGMIPPSIISGIDVVTDGGSALYGADAVGGVINIITRQEMQGGEASVKYGWANGYNSTTANFAFGHEWDNSSFIVAYSYQTNTSLMGSSRSYFRTNLTPFGGSDLRVNQCALGNVNVGGVNYAMPSLVAGTENLCDNGITSSIYPSYTLSTIYGTFNDSITDNVNFSLTATYGERTVDTLLPQVGDSETITSANPFFIPIGNALQQNVSFNYASAAGPSTVAVTGVHQFSISPELDISLPGSWTLNTTGYAGRSKNMANTPEVNPVAEVAALASGDPATALDPYLVSQGNLSVVDAILNYAQQATNKQTLYDVKSVAQGPLYQLPGGAVHAAIGAEYQVNTAMGTQTDAPLGDLAGAATASTRLKDESVFGELMVPIMGGDITLPGVKSFVVDLQGRYDKYNHGFGSTTNPKISFNWGVVNGLKLTGSWGTSFVAPSSADLAGSIDTRLIDFPTSVFGPGPVNQRPTLVLAGGGDNLQPMTSKTYTGGIIINPTWAPELSVSLTYWNTKVKHLIQIFPFFSHSFFFDNFPGAFILNPTLEQVLAFAGNVRMQGPSLESLYSNPATLPYVLMDAQRTNLGTEYLDGIDWNASYTQSTRIGILKLGTSGTFLLNQQQEQLHTNTKVSMLVNGNNISQLIGTAYAGLSYQHWTGRVSWNYSRGFPAGQPPQSRVGSFHPANLFVSYSFGPQLGMKNVSATLNVDNIAGERPQLINAAAEENGIVIGPSLLGTAFGRLVTVGLDGTF